MQAKSQILPDLIVDRFIQYFPEFQQETVAPCRTLLNQIVITHGISNSLDMRTYR
jgi:hypothetical protein